MGCRHAKNGVTCHFLFCYRQVFVDQRALVLAVPCELVVAIIYCRKVSLEAGGSAVEIDCGSLRKHLLQPAVQPALIRFVDARKAVPEAVVDRIGRFHDKCVWGALVRADARQARLVARYKSNTECFCRRGRELVPCPWCLIPRRDGVDDQVDFHTGKYTMSE